ADGSDLRFTDTTCSVLNYWIERGVNTSTCEIWVKVPSIAASTNSRIFLFYGNSSAPAYSNGDNTFILFDDFNGSSLDLTKWVRSTYADPSNTGVSGGYARIEENQTDKYISISSANVTLPSQIRLISKKRAHYGNSYYFGRMTVSNGTIDVGASYAYDSYSGDGCHYSNFNSFYPVPCSAGQKMTPFWQDTWFREEIKWDGAAATNNYYLSRYDGATFQDINTFTAPTCSTNNFHLFFSPYGWWTGHYIDVDYVAAAKYISNEPTVSFGTEVITCH
ncbi:MAG: DUF2341 domain-containing protein, partial [Bacteroidetes bacterium]|nr:DUF2341 domain-containing protein [Bacteroidota bacterium]